MNGLFGYPILKTIVILWIKLYWKQDFFDGLLDGGLIRPYHLCMREINPESAHALNEQTSLATQR